MYLNEKYKKEIYPQLKEKLNLKNPMLIPKLEKIVVNASTGEAIQNSKVLDVISKDMEAVTGQKPVIRKAKKSISNFKLREGMPIGCKVTLRGRIMYEFLDRLVTLALPRTRDFQGVPDKSFDGRGNYTMGIKEHTIFPEIDTDKVTKMHGMDVTFVTSAETDEEAYALLKHFGMPFKNI